MQGDQLVDVRMTVRHSDTGRVLSASNLRATAAWPAGVRESLERAALDWQVAAQQTPDCRLQAGTRELHLRYAPNWRRPFVVEPAPGAYVPPRRFTNWMDAEDNLLREMSDKGILSLAFNVQATAWLNVKADGEVTLVEMLDTRTEPAVRGMHARNEIAGLLRTALGAARMSPVDAVNGLEESRLCWRLNMTLALQSRGDHTASIMRAED